MSGLALFVTDGEGNRRPAATISPLGRTARSNRTLARVIRHPATNPQGIGLIVDGALVGITMIERRAGHIFFHPTITENASRYESTRRTPRRFYGVGRALVVAAVRFSVDLGFEGCVATATSHRSRGFFERLGFEDASDTLRILQGESLSRFIAENNALYGCFN